MFTEGQYLPGSVRVAWRARFHFGHHSCEGQQRKDQARSNQLSCRSHSELVCGWARIQVQLYLTPKPLPSLNTTVQRNAKKSEIAEV